MSHVDMCWLMYIVLQCITLIFTNMIKYDMYFDININIYIYQYFQIFHCTRGCFFCDVLKWARWASMYVHLAMQAKERLPSNKQSDDDVQKELDQRPVQCTKCGVFFHLPHLSNDVALCLVLTIRGCLGCLWMCLGPL